jgi:hypothetical protein
MGPKNPTSSVLSQNQEAIILAYRWRTRLALNDCHERLRRLFPDLSRSALYRCLKRRGYGRIGRTEPCPPLTERNQRGPYTFEIMFNEVVFHDDFLGEIVSVFLAVEEVTKHLYAEIASPTPENAAAFLARLVAESPQRIVAVTTDIHPIFADWRASFNEDMAAVGPHPFAAGGASLKAEGSLTVIGSHATGGDMKRRRYATAEVLLIASPLRITRSSIRSSSL